MTAIRRIACILAELSPADRAALLARLPAPDRIRLSAVHRTQEESRSHVPIGTSNQALTDRERILEHFIDEACQVSSKHQPSSDSAVDFRQFAPSQISDCLKSELPRTIATVLSQMPASLAASVLLQFELPLRVQVIESIVASAPVTHQVANDIAEALHSKLADRDPALGRSSRDAPACQERSGGIGLLQTMLAESAPELQLQLAASIERVDAEFAARMRLYRSA